MLPVIHNYVFVMLEMPLKQFSSLLAKCATPLYILKRRDTDLPVEISNREMMEFRMLCDPAFEQRVSIMQQENEPEVGKEVEIIHGPFAGVHGRLQETKEVLVRKDHCRCQRRIAYHPLVLSASLNDTATMP